MTRTLLVALREFRQITRTRGFWVTLLIVPLAIAATQFAAPLIKPQTSVAYVVADGTNRFAGPMEEDFERSYQRDVMVSLADYAARWAPGDPSAVGPVVSGRRWFSDAEVDAFVASGGAKTALTQIVSRLPTDAPAFKPTPRPAVLVPVPSTVPADQGPDAFGDAMAKALKGNVNTADGKRPLAVAVYIPADFGASGVPAQIWTDGQPHVALIAAIRQNLTSELRAEALKSSGLPAADFTRIEATTAPVAIASPSGGGRQQIVVRSLLSQAVVYLLLITVIVTGSMMLQGMVEERSNKLLESVLACVQPDELMYGKLLGLGAVGLTTILVWVGCAVGAALIMHGAVADLLKPALVSLNQPWMGAALIFYFLAGYVVVSMLYLAIGSLSDSVQDAQAYLAPVMMILMVPTALMMVSSIQRPGGVIPEVLSWIPLYTPFAMLSRLGSGVSLIEVLGTSAMLIAFIALEVFLLGRLFRASLLRSGQATSLPAFLNLMLKVEKN